MPKKIDVGYSSEFLIHPWWKADLTDIRQLIEIMKGSSSVLKIDDGKFEYESLDDLIDHSPRKISKLKITERSKEGEIRVELETNTVSITFHPENHSRQIQVQEFINSRVLKLKMNSSPLMLLASAALALAIAISAASIFAKFMKVGSDAFGLVILVGFFGLLYADVPGRIKRSYCSISLLEKKNQKTYWEIWGEKVFFAVFGIILTIAAQFIIKKFLQ